VTVIGQEFKKRRAVAKQAEDNENGRAKIREVYQLFNTLQDKLDDKFSGINTTLATLMTKMDGMVDTCSETRKGFGTKIAENSNAINNIKVKTYGIAASISVFSIIIGGVIGKYLL